LYDQENLNTSIMSQTDACLDIVERIIPDQIPQGNDLLGVRGQWTTLATSGKANVSLRVRCARANASASIYVRDYTVTGLLTRLAESGVGRRAACQGVEFEFVET
jgi:hypothetical protein